MFVTFIATKERQDSLAHYLPEGSFATVIDFTDKPGKVAFIGRFTGQGTALWRTLAKLWDSPADK